MTSQLEQTIRQWCGESEGWTTPERCLELAQLILDMQPAVVVEIGVFGGRSLIPQALALKENGKGSIIGIDSWSKEAAIEGENEANKNWWLTMDFVNIHRLAAEAIWRFHVQEHAILMQVQSQFCAHLMPEIDILLVDGCHSEIASCRDANLFLPHLKKGGILVADDCDWDSTKKMQEIILKSCAPILDRGDGKMRFFRKFK